jgi:hypothetical protein
MMPNDNPLPEPISGGGLLEFSAELIQQRGGIKGLVRHMMDMLDNDYTPAPVKNQINMFIAKTMIEAQEMKKGKDYTKLTNEELGDLAAKMIVDKCGRQCTCGALRLPWKEKPNDSGTGNSQGT